MTTWGILVVAAHRAGGLIDASHAPGVFHREHSTDLSGPASGPKEFGSTSIPWRMTPFMAARTG